MFSAEKQEKQSTFTIQLESIDQNLSDLHKGLLKIKKLELKDLGQIPDRIDKAALIIQNIYGLTKTLKETPLPKNKVDDSDEKDNMDLMEIRMFKNLVKKIEGLEQKNKRMKKQLESQFLVKPSRHASRVLETRSKLYLDQAGTIAFLTKEADILKRQLIMDRKKLSFTDGKKTNKQRALELSDIMNADIVDAENIDPKIVNAKWVNSLRKEDDNQKCFTPKKVKFVEQASEKKDKQIETCGVQKVNIQLPVPSPKIIPVEKLDKSTLKLIRETDKRTVGCQTPALIVEKPKTITVGVQVGGGPSGNYQEELISRVHLMLETSLGNDNPMDLEKILPGTYRTLVENLEFVLMNHIDKVLRLNKKYQQAKELIGNYERQLQDNIDLIKQMNTFNKVSSTLQDFQLPPESMSRKAANKKRNSSYDTPSRYMKEIPVDEKFNSKQKEKMSGLLNYIFMQAKLIEGFMYPGDDEVEVVDYQGQPHENLSPTRKTSAKETNTKTTQNYPLPSENLRSSLEVDSPKNQKKTMVKPRLDNAQKFESNIFFD